ncbi:linalool 8-monooxygenase [Mycobacterium mantenii]|uniref:Cytochrome P450 n=2 Tax=Mycobacterium mantenii TaxID=560555 RepID=A0A1X0FNH2_MYCNT|nr:cytochrome P450 [Mycobacterium mantenii]ORB02850.1 cytochrome P450 [Mycobacterium mantenii]BBY38023.1 linalool 8-monooxygenase [Mycobacterium mantenii]
MTSTSDVADIDLSTVDLTDLSYWQDGPPHQLFARMRAQPAPHWNALTGVSEPGFWSFTRFADIATISRDPHTFSSARGGVFTTSDGGAVPLEALREILLGMDDPRHGKQRRVVHGVFTPRLVARRETHVRNTVTLLLDDVIEQGRCDFVQDIAVELPLRVIADLLGVPHDDRPKLFEWTNTVSLAQATSNKELGLGAIFEMGAYLTALTAERKANPTDDLVSLLLAAEIDGESLTEDEVTFFFATLMFAGNDTTRNTASGAMRALIEHESERRKLIANPGLVPNAVEEMLRWVCSVVYFARVSQRDTDINGHSVREGDRLVMWYSAGSRDPAVNDDPERFNVTRDKPQHQAFGGGGAHFCIGAALARLELRVLFEELVRRVPDMQIAGPVTRLETNFLNALTSMPVAFTPGKREAVAP